MLRRKRLPFVQLQTQNPVVVWPKHFLTRMWRSKCIVPVSLFLPQIYKPMLSCAQMALKAGRGFASSLHRKCHSVAENFLFHKGWTQNDGFGMVLPLVFWWSLCITITKSFKSCDNSTNEMCNRSACEAVKVSPTSDWLQPFSTICCVNDVLSCLTFPEYTHDMRYMRFVLVLTDLCCFLYLVFQRRATLTT